MIITCKSFLWYIKSLIIKQAIFEILNYNLVIYLKNNYKNNTTKSVFNSFGNKVSSLSLVYSLINKSKPFYQVLNKK